MTSTRPPLLFAASSVVLGVGVGLCLAEVAIRAVAPQQIGPVQFAWNPDLGPVSVPLQHGRRIVPGEYDYSYTNNSLGLRGPREYAIAKPPSTRRMLFLGDSFTYGIGVNDEETFSSLVQRALDRSEFNTEVINAGVPGTGTDHALNFFLKAGSAYHPDLVALFFFPNDVDDNAAHVYFSLTSDGVPQATVANPISSKQWSRFIPAYNWLISWSHLANLLKQAVVRRTMARADGRQATSPQAWDETAVLLRSLRHAVERTGATLVVFYVPSAGEIERRRANQSAAPTEAFIADVSRAGHVEFHSIVPVLAASPYTQAQLYFREGHWTAAAHQVAADFIARTLQDTAPLPAGQHP